jgi:hypothetical protein
MSNFQDQISEQRQFRQFAEKLGEAKNLSQSEAIALAASQVEQVGSQYDGLPFSECLKYAEQQAFKVSAEAS